ncbi:MAG: hypothetical protein PVI26_14780, partial [Chitinispirillia bacterium]
AISKIRNRLVLKIESIFFIKEHNKLNISPPKFNKINQGESQYFQSRYNFSIVRAYLHGTGAIPLLYLDETDLPHI